MSSVQRRILQFQQNDEAAVASQSQHSDRKTPPRDNHHQHQQQPVLRSISPSPSTPVPPAASTVEKVMAGPKKASMTINLSSKPTPPLPAVMLSRPKVFEKPRTPIPKILSPSRSPVGDLNTASILPTSPSIYGSTRTMDWKEKYEEAERKRVHIVTLAQKATRDYEELRRRYQDLGTDKEKVEQRLKNSNGQLEALRNASEAALNDYYKLKKHYHNENTAKSQALNRVDEYNKENRKLKRQSAALLQHFNDGANFDLEQLMETEIEKDEGSEDDREIRFLRARVQDLESRVVDLESELERTKLAEFESQEAAVLINDSVQASAHELESIQGRLRSSEEQASQLRSTVHDLEAALDSITAKGSVTIEKLQETEQELRKIQAEKNALQRQSVVFFSNSTLDAQLEDAMNEIGTIQLQYEEQKGHYETQILNVQATFHAKELDYEAKSIEADAKVKALEVLVEELRQKVEVAEEKWDNQPVIVTPPPPPPPPMPTFLAPPPPPLPSLNSSLQSVTLRKHKEFSSTSSLDSASETLTPEPKSIIPNSSAQIDDVVSQIKRGIKLRSTENRTMNRKEIEGGENKPAESVAIEEMRSILNNLKRTRRIN